MTFLSRPEGRLIWRMDNSRAWRFAPVQFRHAEVRQNSNLAGKQDSLIAGQFVEGFAGDGTLLMTWSKIGVTKKPSAVIITPCSSQDVIVSYNYDYDTAGTIQLKAYSSANKAAFSGALRFSMLVIQ